jgi:peptidoglycan-N-acetylglucosamine deacetylase
MVVIFAVIIAGVALAHMAPFPFLLEAFRAGKSLWHVEPRAGSPPTIYLTFDDGPNADWTPVLLDRLRDESVPATFFLIDAHITPDTEPIVRRIAGEGHAIGLHTGTRRPMLMHPRDLANELKRVAKRIESITGSAPCQLFRPHAGWRSSRMYDGLRIAGYRLAGWSFGMWDWNWWREPHPESAARRLASKASAGDIIVIHDGDHKDPHADRHNSIEIVRLLVPALRSRGFSFGTLCE